MGESETNVRASLSARVAQFVRSQPASRRSRRARASVIAQRDEIARALADGWEVKTIWRTLTAEGSVTVGYQAFRRQVAELIPKPQAKATLAPPTTTPKHRLPAPAADSESRFAHSAVPQKEEIY